MPPRNRFAHIHDTLTQWRRDFHQHPELLFDTFRTSDLVAERLQAMGCDDVVRGLGRTGVVGVIKGNKPGRTIALRADMDALPIPEETGLPHASQTPGKMHACGHDGHTTMLLGAASYLSENRNFAGTVVVIFQPAEEGGGGGREMCEDGLMDRFGIEEVYGMHNWPGQPAGKFAIRQGPFFAATDQFEITVEGRGGHAAKPQETIDPVVIAAQIVTATQSIVSRNVDPVDQMVVSITSIESSSTAFNVIPQYVVMRGTIRTLTTDNRALAEQRICALPAAIAEGFGGKANVRFIKGYPPMVNAERETGFAVEAARAITGQCDDAPLVMGGEDFAYMLEERPGAYILVGNGDTAAVHHPMYDFNDDIIPNGCSYWVELVEQRLGRAD